MIADEIDAENYLPFENEEAEEVTKIVRKLKPETLEEKLVRWESYRKDELVKILTGKCPDVHQAKISALLMRDTHFQLQKGRQAQDVNLDAHKNTALHYALDPQIRGTLNPSELINAILSFNLVEVMGCHVNPHLTNIRGITALDLVDEIEVAQELEQLTKKYRPDIYDRLAFQKCYNRLNKR